MDIVTIHSTQSKYFVASRKFDCGTKTADRCSGVIEVHYKEEKRNFD